MNNGKPKICNDKKISNNSDWDVEPLIERVWNGFGGMVSRSTINDMITEVMPNYENAPIQTYVPIFVYKETVKRLRAGLVEVPPHQGTAVTPDTGD